MIKLRRPLGRPLQLPTHLCHFTTLGGLISIINNHSLWASNVSFLNDKKELRHGIDAAAKVLEEHNLTGEHRRLVSSVLKDLKTYRLPETYATCFCTKNDLLSQWRGYGGRQQGVCISFNGRDLRTAFAHYKVRAMEVIYDKEKTTSRLKSQINKVINEEFSELIGEQSDADMKQDILRTIARLAPRFKDSGFAEEDEWRFVIQREDDISDVSFRENAGVIVPFIEMKSRSGILPIVEITVGPGNHQDMATRGIEMLLTKHGYDHVNIRTSQVPYRT